MPLTPKQQPPYYEKINNVKIYEALLSQNGTNAPTAIILRNTIGNIVWTRQAVGQYYGTLTAAFPLEKTTFYIAQGSGVGIVNELMNQETNIPSDQVFIRTGESDGLLYYTSITITVYP